MRAAVVLASALDVPVLGATARRLTRDPATRDCPIAGIPTFATRPAGDERFPLVIFVNGATPLGRHHPVVQRLAAGLSRVGYETLVPDVPGLRQATIGVEGVAAVVKVAEAALETAGAAEAVALFGVSIGATIALLAAEAHALAERVSVVAAIGPSTDLVNLFRLATTGLYRQGDELVAYERHPFLVLVTLRSVVAALGSSADRNTLKRELEAAGEDVRDALARLRTCRPTLGDEARSAVDLLTNENPVAFDDLYPLLSPRLRSTLELLSPLRGVSQLQATVEIAIDPKDKYFPRAELDVFASAARSTVRVTETSALSHADARLRVAQIRGAAMLAAFAARSLELARSSRAEANARNAPSAPPMAAGPY